MGVTAIILTHNSAATLPATLKSLSFCDERIVVDDESTDATPDIAKKYGAKFVRHALNGDFAAQRNYGMREATHDWVLFVDSDETVSSALAGEIGEAIHKVDAQGFYLKRQDTMWGRELKYGETAHVRLLRLGKKGAGRWIRPVHEVWDITGPVGTLIHPLRHTPHPDVAHFLADVNHYSTINARHLYDRGVGVSWMLIVLYPFGKFIHNYVFRLGFLDGMPGAIMACMMSLHSFLTRGKLWLLVHNRPT